MQMYMRMRLIFNLRAVETVHSIVNETRCIESPAERLKFSTQVWYITVIINVFSLILLLIK